MCSPVYHVSDARWSLCFSVSSPGTPTRESSLLAENCHFEEAWRTLSSQFNGPQNPSHAPIFTHVLPTSGWTPWFANRPFGSYDRQTTMTLQNRADDHDWSCNVFWDWDIRGSRSSIAWILPKSPMSRNDLLICSPPLRVAIMDLARSNGGHLRHVRNGKPTRDCGWEQTMRPCRR